MIGRKLFSIAKPLLCVTSKLLSVLPISVRVSIYEFSSHFSSVVIVGLRYAILKATCREVGDNVFIDKSVTLKNLENLSIGSNVSIHRYSYIDAYGGVLIGDNVSIAHNCSVMSFDHDWTVPDVPIKYTPVKSAPVVIGSDVWIGCGVRILAGVSIVDRVVVGAGAVVSKSLMDRGVYVGVPARKLSST